MRRLVGSAGGVPIRSRALLDTSPEDRHRRQCTIQLALVASSLPAGASQEEARAWRTLAASLPPASAVEVRLKNGERIKGTLVEYSEDALLLKPRTRIPVPGRSIQYDTIDSIERKEPGMSPDKKVLIGIGTGFGVVLLLVAIVVGSME